MLFVLLFFCELLILFFLSRILTRSLSYLFYRITKSQRIMIYLMALLFFPGTLIHELAHAFTALLLFVHVGKMEFVPVMMGNGVKMGSVEIGHSDPIRRALIGMAPFFWGSALMLMVLYAFQTMGGIQNLSITLLTGYVLFEISNTMFSSRKDMEGTLELFIALLVIGVIAYILGFRFPEVNLESIITRDVQQLFLTGSIFLAVPLILDIIMIILLKFLRTIHK